MGIHLFFWLLLAYFFLVDVGQSNPYYFSIAAPNIFAISWTIVFIATFYFNYFMVMPRVLKSLSWKTVLLGFLLGYLFFVGLRFLVEEILLELLFGQSNYAEGTPGIYYLYDNLYYSTYPIIPSSLLWLMILLVRLLEYNKLIVEENKQTEVKFLKAQLNPHFMFNTLNNIYSLVYFQSEKALPAIEKLSSIMRFTTYESQKEEIKLKEEIDYIQSYIELEQLRQQGPTFVELDLNAENLQLQLPPFLLFPLVENALKHGVVTNKETPVAISLEQRGRNLHFSVTNSIGNQKKDKVGGVGLENLKKRLELYFPQQYELQLKKEDNSFFAQLEIRI